MDVSIPIWEIDAQLGVLSNDSDLNGDNLDAVLEDDVQNGTLTLVANNGSFEYVPDNGFSGTDSFSYRASDGDLLSDPVSVTLIINNAPVTACRQLQYRY